MILKRFKICSVHRSDCFNIIIASNGNKIITETSIPMTKVKTAHQHDNKQLYSTNRKIAKYRLDTHAQWPPNDFQSWCTKLECYRLLRPRHDGSKRTELERKKSARLMLLPRRIPLRLSANASGCSGLSKFSVYAAFLLRFIQQESLFHCHFALPLTPKCHRIRII